MILTIVRLGEQLIASGVIDDGQLDAGLAEARATGARLGSVLITLGHATGDQVAIALAKQHGVAAARDRHLASAPPALVAKLPVSEARELGCVIVGEGRDRELIVAMKNPKDTRVLARLEDVTGRIVVAAVASVVRIDSAITRLYPVGGTDIASAAAAAADALGPPASPSPVSRSSRLSIPGVPASIAAAAVAASRESSPDVARPMIPPLDLDAPAPALDLPPLAAQPEATPPPRTIESIESIGLAMGSAPEMTPLTPLPRPRTKTVTASQIPQTRRMAQIAGGTTVRRGVSGLSFSAWRPLAKFILPALFIAGGVIMYRRCTADPSWAVPSDYNSTFLHAHLPLPGTGWRSDESYRFEKKSGADAWARVEGIYRGGTKRDPDEILMVLRVHAPNRFPDEVDMAAFRRSLEGMSREVIVNAGLQSQALDCAVDAHVRTEPAGGCRGSALLRGDPVNLYLFLWEDTVDDTAAVIYAGTSKVDDRIGEVESFIRDIQLQPQ